MIIFERVFSILSYYLAFYFEYINLCSIAKEKHKFLFKNILIIGIISIINYVLALSGIIVFKMVFSFLSIMIISKFLVKLDIKKSLIISIIYYLTILLIEYLSMIVLINILKYNPQKYLLSIGIQKCIIGHIMNIVTYVLCKLFFVRLLYEIICKIFDKIGISNRHIYYFLISIFVIEMMYVTNIVGRTKLIYGILYIVIFVSFIIYLAISLHRNYYLRMLNEFLQEKDKNMQKLLDEYKIFKHNIKNNLLSISSISSKRVKEIIDDYIKSYKLNVDYENNIGSMPDGLRGIIYQKLISNNLLSANIIVDNYLSTDPLNLLNIKQYRQLTESLGIILDNAIEAITNSSEKYIYLYLNESDDIYTIKCVNSFDSFIKVDTLLNHGSTSKNNHNGLGLYYIKNKTCIDVKTRIINNRFYSELILKK